ncbi:ABC transporter substrate-binding protein [Bacillus ndiopicus]|uniref:ABC transporter substrate-binding protein n=1 Tax=Bacillus ndiopicus TaxID=1347368 RepID=UPI0005A87E58|nr:ABC transporter substrate-binding protein [Bacillus ndiopicus]
MKKLFIGFLFCLILVLGACASNKEESSEKEETQTNNNETTNNKVENEVVVNAETTELLAQFPEKVAEKVITTSVPITEMLQLLNIEPIGVPTSTNPLPVEFDHIQRIGSPMAPDLEVITSLEPELLLGAKSLKSSLDESVKGINLQTAYLPTDSYTDLINSFTALGTYFNKQEEMNKILEALAAKEKQLEEQGKDKELPTVMLTIGTADSFMVMNEKSYVGSLIQKLGAKNIATEVLKATDTYSPLNLEEVVVADPDIILVLASGDHGATEEMFKKEVEKNEVWKKLSAYKNDKIHILDYEVFGVTSIKNAEKALTEISTYFYEE